MLRTHAAFGFLIGLLSLNYLNVPNVYIYMALIFIAATIPDIDKSDSKIGKRVHTLSWFIEKTFGHRNLFHSIFPLVAIFLIFFYFLGWNVVGIALLIGYGSHLFIDSFTYMGIGLFHPVHKKRITGFIKTGGIIEHLLFFLLLFVNIILIGNFI